MIAATQVAPLIHRTRRASSQVHSQVSKPWVGCSPTALSSAIYIGMIQGVAIKLSQAFPRHVRTVPHYANWTGFAVIKSQ